MEIRSENALDVQAEVFVATDVTFKDFLTRFDGQHAEWLAGNVVVEMPNNKTHQEIILFLASLLRFYLGYRKIGELFLAGYAMYIDESKPAREPDLVFVLNQHRERIQPTHLDGAADIAIEIVSPESSIRDYGAKFHEYEAAGVTEYWLFDPIRRQADIYVLREDQLYHRSSLNAQSQLVSTLLPGFALDPLLLWREDLPNGAELIALVQQMIV